MEQLYATQSLGRRSRELLAGLGPSAREVAGSLENLGVKGQPNSSGSCAIAEYVSAVIGIEPAVRDVRVYRHNMVIHTDRRWRRVIVPLPPAVRRFVVAFDAGAYPALVRVDPPLGRLQLETLLDLGRLGSLQREHAVEPPPEHTS